MHQFSLLYRSLSVGDSNAAMVVVAFSVRVESRFVSHEFLASKGVLIPLNRSYVLTNSVECCTRCSPLMYIEIRGKGSTWSLFLFMYD